MLKRNLCLYIILTVMILAFSFVIRFSIRDREVVSASQLTDLKDIEFQFLGVFEEEQIPSEDYVKQTLDQSDYILEVMPTGKLKVAGEQIMQEVQVIQCIKGEAIPNHNIWITFSNGFWYKKETDTIYNFGRNNVMSDQSSYIVILSTWGYKDRVYYYNELNIGALRCSDMQIHSYIDTAQKYNYAELEQVEFFAADERTMNKMYDLKEYIFSYLERTYHYTKSNGNIS